MSHFFFQEEGSRQHVLTESFCICFLVHYSSFVERSEVVSPGGKRVITLIHSYGEKGSIFVKAYAKALFKLIDMEPKLSSTENSVTIEV